MKRSTCQPTLGYACLSTPPNPATPTADALNLLASWTATPDRAAGKQTTDQP
jgi:hypothetical protein